MKVLDLFLSFNIFVILLGLLKATEHSEKLFKKKEKVPVLSWRNIISNYSVYSQTDCAFNCGHEDTCAGFKYKFGANGLSVNCQLSDTTGRNVMANFDDQGWVFFIDIAKDLKYNSSTNEKEIATTSSPTIWPQCVANKWLNESSRNQNYSVLETNCDDGLSGWYRFGGEAGNKMAAFCVPASRCGTFYTGWINGAHPTIAEGKVTRKVCFSFSTDCCSASNNVEVVNCGQYYVYNLLPIQVCNKRYCGTSN